jgi:hypothetical protein
LNLFNFGADRLVWAGLSHRKCITSRSFRYILGRENTDHIVGSQMSAISKWLVQ